MRSEALIQDQNHADSVANHPFHVHRGKKLSQEEEIEARIQHVCDLHKNLNAASRVVWLKNGRHTYHPELDLCVKVEAVRWMLRIAKHMSEPAREVVQLRIENSLRQLEAAIESQVYRAELPPRAERLHRSAHA